MVPLSSVRNWFWGGLDDFLFLNLILGAYLILGGTLSARREGVRSGSEAWPIGWLIISPLFLRAAVIFSVALVIAIIIVIRLVRHLFGEQRLF